MPDQPIVKTFSIVACDPEERSWGVAVASKFLAVGALVPHAKAEVGAVATQSAANTSYGQSGLEMMAAGLDAKTTLQKLLEQDPGSQDRQVGLVDANGNAATFTGTNCHAWAGGLTGNNYAIQGNILAGEKVIQSMASVYESAGGTLADRLYAALKAGDEAGGDRRGKQSAALLVVKAGAGYGGFTDRYLDLRVDNHAEPVVELGHLLELHHLFLGKDPSVEKIKIEGKVLEEIGAILSKLGYLETQSTFEWNPALQQAFETFVGVENLEERVNISQATIDKPALDYVRNNFGRGSKK